MRLGAHPRTECVVCHVPSMRKPRRRCTKCYSMVCADCRRGPAKLCCVWAEERRVLSMLGFAPGVTIATLYESSKIDRRQLQQVLERLEIQRHVARVGDRWMRVQRTTGSTKW